VSAPATASLPLAGQDHHDRQYPAPLTTTDPSSARRRGDSVRFRRCPFSHTPRCPRFFTVSSTKSGCCRALSGSAFGSTHEGGATPPAVENVDPTSVDVGPCRDVAPPSQQFAVGEWTCATHGAARSPRNVSLCDCARSDSKSYGRARPRQGFARFARRGHDREPRP
jgi:hypothetical protein